MEVWKKVLLPLFLYRSELLIGHSPTSTVEEAVCSPSQISGTSSRNHARSGKPMLGALGLLNLLATGAPPYLCCDRLNLLTAAVAHS